MIYSDKLGAIIRKELDVASMPIDRFRVRAARDAREMLAAFSMLHEAYVGKGLQQANQKNLRITPQHVLRESVIFVAWEENEPVATVTVTGDTPAGLPLDKDYASDMARLRGPGVRLVEVGSLAVRKDWRGSGVHALLSMVTMWAARRILRGSHAVVGIHPSHAGFYRAVFGFEPLAPPQAHAELDAPVTGMVVPLASCPGHLRAHFTQPLANGQQLADEFCGPLPPSCVEVAGALLHRNTELWRIPRHVFQEVFIRQSDRLYTLDEATRRYLESQRTIRTLRHQALDCA